MKPPMCFRHPGIRPNLAPYSMCLVCQFNTDCISTDPLPPEMQETEWVCKACYDTTCRFTVNAKLQLVHPVRCPLSGMEGTQQGLPEHWTRIK
jgi:hypothetical protein